MIIAVDGPTASGKGTLARALAAHFGLPFLDTGLLYRAVGRYVQLHLGNADAAARSGELRGGQMCCLWCTRFYNIIIHFCFKSIN